MAGEPPEGSRAIRVVALISAFNEGDVIEPVLEHLAENGVLAYLIDHRSTDDTVERARRWLRRGLIGVETFPPDGAEAQTPGFAWGAILERKLALARQLPADWFIHHDADEIREGPWPGVGLRDAILWVDLLGYNAIDFRLLNFPPVDDGFAPGDDPRTYFTRFEEGPEHDRIQIKAWKAGPLQVRLPDGGHHVTFPGRRVFPVRFLLRHYPIRGQTHGLRKVLVERRERFVESERALGWHLQYDEVRGEDHVFPRNPASLRPFDLDRARLEVQLEGRDAGGLAAVPAPPREAEAGARQGHLDRADPERIAGWAWNARASGEPARVDLWDGARLLATVRADGFRADLERSGKGDGRAAFALSAPAGLRDGRGHWVWANFAGTAVALRGAPRVIAPAGLEATPTAGGTGEAS